MAARRSGTILVAVDFSEPSRGALKEAADLASRIHARLEVVHVIPPLSPSTPFSRKNRELVDRIEREAIAQAERELRRILPRRRDLDLQTRLLTGVPSEQILARADKVRARLIVLARRGQNLAERLLMGSTADRVLRRSRRPVLLVPDRPASRG